MALQEWRVFEFEGGPQAWSYGFFKVEKALEDPGLWVLDGFEPEVHAAANGLALGGGGEAGGDERVVHAEVVDGGGDVCAGQLIAGVNAEQRGDATRRCCCYIGDVLLLMLLITLLSHQRGRYSSNIPNIL